MAQLSPDTSEGHNKLSRATFTSNYNLASEAVLSKAIGYCFAKIILKSNKLRLWRCELGFGDKPFKLHASQCPLERSQSHKLEKLLLNQEPYPYYFLIMRALSCKC